MMSSYCWPCEFQTGCVICDLGMGPHGTVVEQEWPEDSRRHPNEQPLRRRRLPSSRRRRSPWRRRRRRRRDAVTVQSWCCWRGRHCEVTDNSVSCQQQWEFCCWILCYISKGQIVPPPLLNLFQDWVAASRSLDRGKVSFLFKPLWTRCYCLDTSLTSNY